MTLYYLFVLGETFVTGSAVVTMRITASSAPDRVSIVIQGYIS